MLHTRDFKLKIMHIKKLLHKKLFIMNNKNKRESVYKEQQQWSDASL